MSAPLRGRLSYPETLLWIALRDFSLVERKLETSPGWRALSAESFRRRLDDWLQTESGVIEYEPAAKLTEALTEGSVSATGVKHDERQVIPASEWSGALSIIGTRGEVYGGAHGGNPRRHGSAIIYSTLSFFADEIASRFPGPKATTPIASEEAVSAPASAALPPRIVVKKEALKPEVLTLAFATCGDGASKGKLAVAVAAILNQQFGPKTTTAASVEASWRDPPTDVPELRKLARLNP